MPHVLPLRCVLLLQGMPMVVLEAFAAAKPVVAVDTGATKEMLEVCPESMHYLVSAPPHESGAAIPLDQWVASKDRLVHHLSEGVLSLLSRRTGRTGRSTGRRAGPHPGAGEENAD